MENEPQDAYIPASDDEILQPFDAREQSGRRGMMMLLGGFLLLLVLAFIVLKLFSSGTRDRDQTPRILAENDPYKVQPIDPGGAQTPNQDKAIYDVLNGNADNTAVSAVATSEQPMPLPKAETVPVREAANIVIKENAPAIAASKPANVQTPARTIPAVSGDYVVQVASLRTQAEANGLWDSLINKHTDVLSAVNFADIKRVDLDAKGIYYRLRIGGLADKSAADRLCTQLKARNQDCIVTRK